MTARELIETWQSRDERYAAPRNTYGKSEEAQVAIRWWRLKECAALPGHEQATAYLVLNRHYGASR